MGWWAQWGFQSLRAWCGNQGAMQLVRVQHYRGDGGWFEQLFLKKQLLCTSVGNVCVADNLELIQVLRYWLYF